MGCSLAKAAGADFVKTSTGFAGGGATVEDVRLMRAGRRAPRWASRRRAAFAPSEDAKRMIAAGSHADGRLARRQDRARREGRGRATEAVARRPALLRAKRDAKRHSPEDIRAFVDAYAHGGFPTTRSARGSWRRSSTSSTTDTLPRDIGLGARPHSPSHTRRGQMRTSYNRPGKILSTILSAVAVLLTAGVVHAADTLFTAPLVPRRDQPPRLLHRQREQEDAGRRDPGLQPSGWPAGKRSCHTGPGGGEGRDRPGERGRQ